MRLLLSLAMSHGMLYVTDWGDFVGNLGSVRSCEDASRTMDPIVIENAEVEVARQQQRS